MHEVWVFFVPRIKQLFEEERDRKKEKKNVVMVVRPPG